MRKKKYKLYGFPIKQVEIIIRSPTKVLFLKLLIRKNINRCDAANNEKTFKVIDTLLCILKPFSEFVESLQITIV